MGRINEIRLTLDLLLVHLVFKQFNNIAFRHITRNYWLALLSDFSQSQRHSISPINSLNIELSHSRKTQHAAAIHSHSDQANPSMIRKWMNAISMRCLETNSSIERQVLFHLNSGARLDLEIVTSIFGVHPITWIAVLFDSVLNSNLFCQRLAACA